MAFTGPIQLSSQELARVGTLKLMPLGTLGVDRTGATFRYGLAGAVALSLGKLVQVPAVVANHQNLAVTAAAIGDRQVNVTLGATAATAEQYTDGVLGVYDSVGAGQRFLVATNPAIVLSTAGIIQLEDPVMIALTTASKVNLSLNSYAGALVYATGATTEFATGVPINTIPIANYGWFQTKGLAQVLTNGTITKGSGVVPGQTTAGSVDIEATSTIVQRVGIQYETGTSTKYSTTYLTID